MDSLGDLSLLDKYPPERVLRYPADKDFTDTELALNLLFEKGCAEVTLAGGGGGRLDHTLAIAALFEREDAPSRWFTAHEEIVLVKGAFRQRACAGNIVSVFPIGAGPWKAASVGLKWPLDAVRWRRGYSGVSNVAVADSIAVTALAGRFLLIATPCQ
jgi:thiamine pyrophosphokinase